MESTRPAGVAEATAGSRPEVTQRLFRGLSRHLRQEGFSPLAEVPLANGRRADLLALDGAGALLLFEVKSSLADFRADAKWRDYLDYCDYFYFCVAADFPQTLLPVEAGLYVADAYGAALLRDSPRRPLAPARRRALLLSFAHLSARRLQGLLDPDGSS